MKASIVMRCLIGASVFMLSACGSASAPSMGATASDKGAATSAAPNDVATAAASLHPRPAALADLPFVELVGPSTTGAGLAPIFEWRAADGASGYRLSVRGPQQRSWAWSGKATSVRYGGTVDRQAGPVIVPGMRWSVAAFDHDGSIVALSELRPLSPTDEPGPEPDWITAAQPTPVASPEAGDEDAATCALLGVDEISAAIEGAWEAVNDMGYRCEWRSRNGSVLSIDLLAAETYDPEGWGADETIDQLGDRAYRVTHGWDRRIGFVRDDVSVMLVIDYTKVDADGFLHLARLVEGRVGAR